MKTTPEIHEFFVEGTDQERSHVLLHITEPGSPEEKAKGYFFAVAEINNGSLEQIEHLQQMIDDLETGYYETEDEAEKNAFEISLEYINRRGHHILQYKNSLISCLVGVWRGQELFFAFHGHPHALLFYQDKGELRQLNILQDQEAELDGGQLFSSLLQGALNDGDYFYLASPHVNDYFTFDRIKKILLTRNTRQSAAHIQKVLKDLDNDLSFGGIIFHLPGKTELIKSGKRVWRDEHDGSVHSLERMINQERSTEEIMAAPLWGAWKKKMHAYQEKRKMERNKKNQGQKKIGGKKEILNKKHGAVETNFRPRPNKPEKDSLLNIILISLGKGLVAVAMWLYNFFRWLLPVLGRGSVGLILLISNKDGKRGEVVSAMKKELNKKRANLAELPLSSKIILALTVVLTLIFVASLATYKVRANLQARQQAYLNQVQGILDKKNAADAGLIYGDEAMALALLQEAKNAIAGLPDSSRKEKDKILELTAEVEAGLMKLRKLETIFPQALVDLTQFNPTAKTSRLSAIGDQLIAFGPEDAQLYKFNLISQNLEIKDHAVLPRLYQASTPKEEDGIIFLTGSDNIAQYHKESSTLSVRDISFPQSDIKLANLFVYNRRLYTLNPASSQIYKHQPTQTGFDKGVAWLTDGSEIKNGVSLTIDGDIFVLTDNDLLKFTGGVRQEFQLTGLDPRLDNPAQVWTYNDVNNIYILEPTNKRVVALDKNGKLIKQYTALEWQNPTGMVVNEAEKIIYVLDNNIIYKFNF